MAALWWIAYSSSVWEVEEWSAAVPLGCCPLSDVGESWPMMDVRRYSPPSTRGGDFSGHKVTLTACHSRPLIPSFFWTTLHSM